MSKNSAFWRIRGNANPADWRIWLPAALIPLLLLCTLALLLKSYQLGNDSRTQFNVLQDSWQNIVISRDGAISSSADTVNEQVIVALRDDPGLKGLADLNSTLQSWLQQQAEDSSFAPITSNLGAIVSDRRAGNINNSEVDFWTPVSDLVATLEAAVSSRAIDSPEARALIRELRNEVNRLREPEVDNSGLRPTRQIDFSSLTQATGSGEDVARARQLSAAAVLLSEQLTLAERLGRLALWTASAALILCFVAYLSLPGRRKQVAPTEAVAGSVDPHDPAMIRMLEEMAPTASGDLRQQVSIHNDSLAPLAIAFNHLLTELRWVVSSVKSSAQQVHESVSAARASSAHFSHDGSVQSREVHRSSNYLNVMSDTMAQLSAHAAESSRLADTAVTQSEAGADAVATSIDALLRIRQQAEMTSRLMQGLLESSEAIHTRVADIRDVAKRTDLLALNTTIRAAGTAEYTATDDLSQLADEVSGLADVLNTATRNIGSVTDIIRRDAAETMHSMSQTVVELEAGLDEASQASVSLDQIRQLSKDLQLLIAKMADKSLRQAGVVRQLSGNMAVINKLALDSSAHSLNSDALLESLEKSCSELCSSVDYFSLPATPAPEENHKLRDAARRQLASVKAADLSSND